MKKAIPIDKDGCIIGGVVNFTDERWDTMIYNYGKKLRWRLIGTSGEEEPKKEDEPIFEYNLDENLTKRELIEKYGLEEELMKSTKPEIIEIIKSGEQYK